MVESCQHIDEVGGLTMLHLLRWRWIAGALLVAEPVLHLLGIPHPELGQQALNLLATVEPSDG